MTAARSLASAVRSLASAGLRSAVVGWVVVGLVGCKPKPKPEPEPPPRGSAALEPVKPATPDTQFVEWGGPPPPVVSAKPDPAALIRTQQLMAGRVPIEPGQTVYLEVKEAANRLVVVREVFTPVAAEMVLAVESSRVEGTEETLLRVRNPSKAMWLTFRVTAQRDGRPVPTKTCPVAPRNEGPVHWEEPISKMVVSDFILAATRPPSCK